MDVNNITTEGIKYTGSKKILIPKIINSIKDLDIRTTLDGFAGTTRVGQSLKLMNYSVDSNDVSDYSDIFAKCYIVNNQDGTDLLQKIDYLNSLPGIDGWYTKNYGGDVGPSNTVVSDDNKKKIWQRKNTMKLDQIRDEIDIISDNDIEKSILLTSLILSLDKVDSTIGHQVSYLKNWSKRSFGTLKLELPKLIIGDKNYNSIKGDIMDIDKEYDFIYLDPPYGTNNKKMPTSRIRYYSYYHLWTTIVRNDKPELFGSSNRRLDGSDKNLKNLSDYERVDYEYVIQKIESLIYKLNTKYLMFSYNNKGTISIDDLDRIFSKYKILSKEIIEYKENVMKNMKWENKWQYDNNKNYEYLYLIKK
ncbi:MAG: DNA adenine methylase [Candidatus Woesearchaeota archaeon]